MKKFILILCMITLVGCGKTVPSANMDISEVQSETSPKIQYEPTTESTFDAVTDIEVGEPDKNYYLNSNKTLFSDDKGSYYYVYKDGRDSGYYVLGCETKDNKYSFLKNADDFNAYLYKDGIFYGSYIQDKICSFKDGKYTSLYHEENEISDFYFTDSYIYFLYRSDSGTEIFRMGYNGSDIESIAFIDLQISKYSVHGNKIFYEADYLKYGVFDTETGTDTALDNGGAGIFCGDYMYYVSGEHHLFRMNINDYSYEKICENVRRFAFYDGYIIYQMYQPYAGDTANDCEVYRLGKGENKKIFDAYEHCKHPYYYDISVIQADKDNIFIEVSSGPYYKCIAEIDIDGNLIKKVYEHTSV